MSAQTEYEYIKHIARANIGNFKPLTMAQFAALRDKIVNSTEKLALA